MDRREQRIGGREEGLKKKKQQTQASSHAHALSLTTLQRETTSDKQTVQQDSLSRIEMRVGRQTIQNNSPPNSPHCTYLINGDGLHTRHCWQLCEPRFGCCWRVCLLKSGREKRKMELPHWYAISATAKSCNVLP